MLREEISPREDAHAGIRPPERRSPPKQHGLLPKVTGGRSPASPGRTIDGDASGGDAPSGGRPARYPTARAEFSSRTWRAGRSPAHDREGCFGRRSPLGRGSTPASDRPSEDLLPKNVGKAGDDEGAADTHPRPLRCETFSRAARAGRRTRLRRRGRPRRCRPPTWSRRRRGPSPTGRRASPR